MLLLTTNAGQSLHDSGIKRRKNVSRFIFNLLINSLSASHIGRK